METQLSKNVVIKELLKSPHGQYKEYVPIGARAAIEDADFFAHLIAWNEKKGAIRDSKVALPIVSLSISGFAFVENSLAHLALLSPRNLVKAIRFAKDVKTPGNAKALVALVERYLRERERFPKWMTASMLQHRASMKELYALNHIKPSEFANDVLFKGKKPGVFGDVAELSSLLPGDAANRIMVNKIPFLVAVSAMGKKASDPTFLMALIESMSPAELVNNTKMLDNLGVKNHALTRAAYEAKLAEASQSKKVSALKVAKAADVTGSVKLKSAQEKQIDANMSIEGNWVVFADKSGSMQAAINLAIEIASILARAAKGNVHLVFFDNAPRYIPATGRSLDEIKALTSGIMANGGTAPGNALRYVFEKGFVFDGIVLVSDGGENGRPKFHEVYNAKYKDEVIQPPVYFYQLSGDRDTMSMHMEYNTFDLRGGVIDYYSLPNLVQTMRISRYSLIDEIFEMPLLSIDDVFKKEMTNERQSA